LHHSKSLITALVIVRTAPTLRRTAPQLPRHAPLLFAFRSALARSAALDRSCLDAHHRSTTVAGHRRRTALRVVSNQHTCRTYTQP